MKNRIFILFVVVFFINSCALKRGYVLYEKKPNDIITTNELKEYIAENPNPTIVVRAPNSSNSMTEIDQNGQLYNIIEKELLKGGFNIKDRALFNQVIENNASLSYQDIYEITKTDLILELTNLDNGVRYNTNVIYDVNHQKVIYENYNIIRRGASIEFKIIYLRENQMLASYTFNYSPCTEEYNDDCTCAVAYKCNSLHPYYNYCKNGEVIAYETVETDILNEFVKFGIIEFIKQIK